MTWHATHISKVTPGVSHPRTPVEYLHQEEVTGPLHHTARPSDGTQAEWQSFSLGGHRLSSLYRKIDKTAFWLMRGKTAPASSWEKYSQPTFTKSTVTGAKA